MKTVTFSNLTHQRFGKGLKNRRGDVQVPLNTFLFGIFLAFIMIVLVFTTSSVPLTKPFSSESLPTAIASTPFPVDAWGEAGWSDCSKQDGGWTAADAFCKCQGHLSAYPADEKPCFYENSNQRYKWSVSCAKPGSGTGAGMALTKVKCRA